MGARRGTAAQRNALSNTKALIKALAKQVALLAPSPDVERLQRAVFAVEDLSKHVLKIAPIRVRA
jgi:hypothetical protein